MKTKKRHIKEYLIKLLGIVLICTTLIPISCARKVEEKPEREYTVVYLYKPPVTIKYQDQIPLLVPESTEISKEMLERKLSALAKALGIPFDPVEAKVKMDPDAETAGYSYGTHRFKIYLRSGMIKYADTQVYNVIPRDFRKQQALPEKKAIQLAKEVVERLDAQEIIEKEELLWDAPYVYHSKLQEGLGGPEGGGQAPEPEPPYDIDTRVFLSRIKEGLPVSGSGLRLVFTPEGKLASLNLMWRDLQTSPKAYAIITDMARAKVKFEESLNVPKGARVEVLVNELVYFDPSPRDSVSFLEPGFLFVYVVKTPLKEKPGVFGISKKLHYVVPVVEHGLSQIPSTRKERLKQLESEYGKETRPERIVPPTEQDEREQYEGETK